MLRKTRGQPRHPADVAGLLTDLLDTADQNIIDQPRIEVVACQQLRDGLGQQFDGMELGEGATGLAFGEGDRTASMMTASCM